MTLHARGVSLLLRNLVFTIVVPGSGAVLLPWLLVGGRRATDGPLAWLGVALIVAGAVLYLWCLWLFARVGRGTPGPWDAPRRLVVAGPYRWVRNPIYIGALLVIAGETALFASRARARRVPARRAGHALMRTAHRLPAVRAGKVSAMVGVGRVCAGNRPLVNRCAHQQDAGRASR